SLTLATTTVSCSDDDTTTPEEQTSDFKVDRNNLTGEIKNGHVVLTDGTYKLTGKLIVGNGAKLTIKAGVKIEATALGSGQFDAVRIGRASCRERVKGWVVVGSCKQTWREVKEE